MICSNRHALSVQIPVYTSQIMETCPWSEYPAGRAMTREFCHVSGSHHKLKHFRYKVTLMIILSRLKLHSGPFEFVDILRVVSLINRYTWLNSMSEYHLGMIGCTCICQARRPRYPPVVRYVYAPNQQSRIMRFRIEYNTNDDAWRCHHIYVTWKHLGTVVRIHGGVFVVISIAKITSPRSLSMFWRNSSAPYVLLVREHLIARTLHQMATSRFLAMYA